MGEHTWQSTLENKAVDAYLNYLTTVNCRHRPNIDAKLEVMDARDRRRDPHVQEGPQLVRSGAMAQPTITADDLIDDFVKHAGVLRAHRHHLRHLAGDGRAGRRTCSRAGIGPNKNKMAPDDLNRKRPYHLRKT